LSVELDGSLYTTPNGYDGPAVGLGDGILSLGTYGSFGAPSSSTLKTVEGIADAVAAAKLFPTTDVFVYAIDETCSSSYGADWKTLLAGSSDANVKNVKVGWTCSTDPSAQPVDIPIVWGGEFNLTTANAARAKGKDVWIYNGARPSTGSFLTDTEAVELRANGWIGGVYPVGRWFYWETAFWYDGNSGGHGPYDPFVTSETFHNNYGDECQGDGVLVYPGKQVDMFTADSVGIDAVLASIRLKNWRRGIEDAGYYQLAHAADAAKAETIAKGLLGNVLDSAKGGDPVSYPEKGKPWFDARKALLDLIPKDITPGGDAGLDGGKPDASGDTQWCVPCADDGTDFDALGPNADNGGGSSSGCGCRTTSANARAGSGFAFAAIALFAARRRRARA
jgi:MYXO-CTERM domain-containing protein